MGSGVRLAVDSCTYRHQGEQADGWECPHPAEDVYCIFHDPRSEAGAVREAFDGALRHGRTGFVGATPPDLSLERVDRDTNLDLRDASVGMLDCTEAALTELQFSGATIEEICGQGASLGEIQGRYAVVTGHVDLREAKTDDLDRTGATLAGGLDLHEGDFGDLVLDGATVDGRFGAGFATMDRASVVGARFSGDAGFSGVTFRADAGFFDTAFEGHTSFVTATFEGYSSFSARFEATVDFVDATFRRPALFPDAQFVGRVSFASCRFVEGIDAAGTTFGDTTSFFEATFAGQSRLDTVHFEGYPCFIGTEFERAAFAEITSSVAPVDLTAATVSAGTARLPDDGSVAYDLTRATLGDVQLEGDADPFRRLRIRGTEFDGFAFADYRTDLAPSWRLDRYDGPILSGDERVALLAEGTGPDARDVRERIGAVTPSPGTEEWTYLRARNGASETADTRAASGFFIREMRARRRGHAAAALDGERSTGTRFHAAADWLANWLLGVTCGYGERPRNVVLASFVVVGGFTFGYRVAGAALPNWPDYLTFSLRSFVTLVLGTAPDGTNAAVRLLGASEAFIRAFFIALFVFTLTRSIHR